MLLLFYYCTKIVSCFFFFFFFFFLCGVCFFFFFFSLFFLFSKICGFFFFFFFFFWRGGGTSILVCKVRYTTARKLNRCFLPCSSNPSPITDLSLDCARLGVCNVVMDVCKTHQEEERKYPTQGHTTTVFCKISVRRSKYCLEFSIA